MLKKHISINDKLPMQPIFFTIRYSKKIKPMKVQIKKSL